MELAITSKPINFSPSPLKILTDQSSNQHLSVENMLSHVKTMESIPSTTEWQKLTMTINILSNLM